VTPLDYLDRLAAASPARVLIVGDVILDRYIEGRVDRISPEAPVPVLRHGSSREMLGGAGNVAANIASLGGKAELVGLVGPDRDGAAVRQLLDEWEIRVDGLSAVSRPTSVKTRFIAQGQQVLRHDWEVTDTLTGQELDAVLAAFRNRLASADILVLSDYGKGTICREVAAAVIAAARQMGKRVLVDPKNTDYRFYAGATAVTPNRKELAEASGMTIHDDASVEAACAKLIADCGLEAVLATRSEDGLSVIRAGAPPVHIPTQAQEVFDVSGAGDTVVAALALGLASGLDWAEAAALANAAAGVVVAKRGTAQVTLAELRASRSGTAFADTLVVDRAGATRQAEAWRKAGLTVGFTNGCFDLLHPGHVSLLAFARSNCDRLVVGLNDDASVSRLKGPSRPVTPLDSRALILAALKPVDLVCSFPEDTPYALIKAVLPDVLIKGADYTVDAVVGADVVQAHGGRVLLAPLVDGQSTTGTIARLDKKGQRS